MVVYRQNMKFLLERTVSMDFAAAVKAVADSTNWATIYLDTKIITPMQY